MKNGTPSLGLEQCSNEVVEAQQSILKLVREEVRTRDAAYEVYKMCPKDRQVRAAPGDLLGLTMPCARPCPASSTTTRPLIHPKAATQTKTESRSLPVCVRWGSRVTCLSLGW